MSDHLRNFQSWYSEILQDLSRKENSGLAMLMIVSPLLERYLREKSGARENNHLAEAFFDELRKIFPALSDNSIARRFWSDFRQGLLHEVALTQQPDGSEALFQETGAMLSIDAATGKFELCPALFAGKVIETIEADFETFEGKNGLHHSPAKVHVSKGGKRSGNAETVFEYVGQASSLPVHGASSPRVSSGRMPPELADKMSAPHFQTSSETPVTGAMFYAKMRVIFNSSSHSANRSWRIPYPKEMGVLLMVFALLTILIAHAGFGLPVIMEITRVFEAPDETINYESSAIHWFFIVEAIVFAIGSGLVIYSLFRRKQADASPPRENTGPRNKT